jgi:L-lactate dehydrogenase (cytochrome)
MKSCPSIEDLRQRARRRVPKLIFESVEAGSYDQETLRANRSDLEALTLRQRVLVDVDRRDAATVILGEKAALPLVLAPVGGAGMVHGDGEIAACRAAQAAGIPYALSTMSTHSIEDVAGSVEKPFWFQLFLMRDRGFARELIGRAASAKCSALVMTVDMPVFGQRHCDIRNGLTAPPKIKVGSIIGIAARPAWAMSMLRSRRRTWGNLAGRVKGADSVSSTAQWIASQFDPTYTWKDVEWVKGLWPGKLVLKGILDADDARIATSIGVDAIGVSNHGGRQLDGALSAISALPRVADAVGSSVEVTFDGGVRTGADIVRALALGARACLIGRSYIYGLGAAGQAGVARAIEILANELDVTMALCGLNSVAEIDRTVLAGAGGRQGAC